MIKDVDGDDACIPVLSIPALCDKLMHEFRRFLDWRRSQLGAEMNEIQELIEEHGLNQ